MGLRGAKPPTHFLYCTCLKRAVSNKKPLNLLRLSGHCYRVNLILFGCLGVNQLLRLGLFD